MAAFTEAESILRQITEQYAMLTGLMETQDELNRVQQTRIRTLELRLDALVEKTHELAITYPHCRVACEDEEK